MPYNKNSKSFIVFDLQRIGGVSRVLSVELVDQASQQPIPIRRLEVA